MQKQYIYKIYALDGTLQKTLTADDVLNRDVRFESKINSGQREMNLQLKMPWFEPEPWTEPGVHIMRVFMVNERHPKGILIYAGMITKRRAVFNATDPLVEITCLGLVYLLGRTRTQINTFLNKDPGVIATEVVDTWDSDFPFSSFGWVGYNAVSGIRAGGNIVNTGTPVDEIRYTVSEGRSYIDVINDAKAAADSGYWWYIDQGGDVFFKQKPPTATHAFTLGKDVDELVPPENFEGLVNAVSVIWSGSPGITTITDSASITKYGRRERVLDKQNRVVDAATATKFGNDFLQENNTLKKQATVVLNSQFDYEKIRPGDTCKILNIPKSTQPIVASNMQIVTVRYGQETCTLELEGEEFNFGGSLEDFISRTN